MSAQSTTINPATFAASVSAIRGDVFTLQGGGEVIANLPDSMTQRDYDDLKDWLELMIRKAGRKVVVQTSIAAPVDEDEDGDED